MELSFIKQFEPLLKECSVFEFHGGLTALVCIKKEEKVIEYLYAIGEQFEQIEDKKTLFDTLIRLKKDLNQDDYDFSLLLDQSSSLKNRVFSFSKWCQGFIFALGLFVRQPSEEVSKILQDLIPFTSLEFDLNIEDNQEDEMAFEEVVEFTKIAVLLIKTHFN